MRTLPSPRPGILLRIVLAVLLALAGPVSAMAQVADGAIEGRVVEDSGGAPVAFAIVRLLRVDQSLANPWPGLTDDAGRFRFDRLPAGNYRVQLERVGFERALSPTLTVKAGETLTHELRAAGKAVLIEGLTIRGDVRCLDASTLASDKDIAAVWREAKKGMEIRQALQRQFRFSRSIRQDIELRRRLLPDQRGVRMDTVVYEPDSVGVREQRRRASRRAEGWGKPGGLLLTIPDERDLLDEAFLEDHCVETTIDGGEGTIAVHFRPITPRSDRLDISGSITMDADTYVIRRLDLAWLDAGQSMGHGTIGYSDVAVEGGRLRLPTSGRLSARPTGSLSLVTGADAELTISNWGFQPVRPR